MDPSSTHKNYRFAYRAEDVEELTNKSTFALARSFGAVIENYKKIYKHGLSNEERTIIDRLGKEHEVPFSEISEQTVQPLIDTALITRDIDRRAYRLNGALFKRVVSDPKALNAP